MATELRPRFALLTASIALAATACADRSPPAHFPAADPPELARPLSVDAAQPERADATERGGGDDEAEGETEAGGETGAGGEDAEAQAPSTPDPA